MSGSPPPFDQETRNETEVEVDLSSNQTESKLDDNDLFFSTISDPNLMEKVKLNAFFFIKSLKLKLLIKKKQPIEDMDEVFKINSPTNAIKEIKLTDDEEDDPFSLDNEKKVNNTSSNPVSVSIQPSISSNTIKEDSFYSLVWDHIWFTN